MNIDAWAAYALFAGPFGKDARHRGELCRVVERKGVKVVGEYGENAGLITKVSLLADRSALSGERVEIGDIVDGAFVPSVAYTLDAVLEDDGAVKVFAAIPTQIP